MARWRPFSRMKHGRRIDRQSREHRYRGGERAAQHRHLRRPRRRHGDRIPFCSARHWIPIADGLACFPFAPDAAGDRRVPAHRRDRSGARAADHLDIDDIRRSVHCAPDADHWCCHARRAVRFQQGMQALVESGVGDFIEVGPGNALLALGQQCLDGRHAWLGSLGNKRRSDLGEILTSLGELYIRGYEVDWDGFNAPYSRRRVSLPTYPFDRRRYWLDDDAGAQSRVSSAAATTMAGRRLRSALPRLNSRAPTV